MLMQLFEALIKSSSLKMIGKWKHKVLIPEGRVFSPTQHSKGHAGTICSTCSGRFSGKSLKPALKSPDHPRHGYIMTGKGRNEEP
jgi:hypothetical protein